MDGASKLVSILTTTLPLPVPIPLPSALRLARRSGVPVAALSSSADAPSSYGTQLLFSSPRTLLRFAVREVANAHTQAPGAGGANAEVAASLPSSSAAHSWPEWSRLVDFLFTRGYYDRPVLAAVDNSDDDSLLDGEELTEQFVKATEACLLFARDRPDLLRSLGRRDIEIIVENGSPFLFKNGANSARRLRSFLSCDRNNVLESEIAKTCDVMRYLLSYVCNSFVSKDEKYLKTRQLTETSVRSLLAELVNVSTAGEESKLSESTPNQTALRQQFSRSPGHSIGMKRGDWICPKCSSMNYARNMKCFECKETRPRKVLTGGEWECPQCDFYNYGRNMSCLRCHCKRPGEAPQNIAATGIGTPHNQSSIIQNNIYRPSGMSGMESNKASESSISQRLDSILGRSSTVSGMNHQAAPAEINGGTGNSQHRDRIPSQRRDADNVPFVPSLRKDDSVSPMTDSKDKDSSDAAEKWSKKVAEIDNASGNSIFDDFPEIMPMRKGENRFVISKKKDRSLTSPQYKRRIALEQGSSSNFVPFVPFPPDYFAKKDEQPEASPTKDSASEDTATFKNAQAKQEEFKTGVPISVSSQNASLLPEIQSTSLPNSGKTSNTNSSGENLNMRKIEAVYNGKTSDTNSSGQNLNMRKVEAVYDGASATSAGAPAKSWNNSNKNWNSEHSPSTYGGEHATTNSQQAEGSQTAKEGSKPSSSGKSLEGSLVKELDPTDMSEEAKAARWFRRVAQIKDISELSNIPDEDFPEIMPMRKGVNRFVVSKRKTPLERRLTSPQYRKNLPVVSSDPEKDDN